MFGFVSVATAAVYGLLLERAGKMQCACLPSCWCKQPGLMVFRWITPNDWHRRWTLGMSVEAPVTQ